MPIFRTQDPYVSPLEWVAFIVVSGIVLGVVIIELLRLVL